jgi:hypothetical protein
MAHFPLGAGGFPARDFVFPGTGRRATVSQILIPLLDKEEAVGKGFPKIFNYIFRLG